MQGFGRCNKKLKVKSEKLRLNIKNYYLKFCIPIGFIIFVWFIFANPYFIKHTISFPAQYMASFFTPWNVYPKFQICVKNNSLSDVANELYPSTHFTIESLKSVHIR